MGISNVEQVRTPTWWQTGIFCVLLLLSVIASWLILQDRTWLATLGTETKFQLENGIPKTFAEWQQIETNSVIEIPAETRAALDSVYNQQLVRTYINAEGQKVMLSISYGEDQSNDLSQAHRPEICYVAQGFSLLHSQTTNMQISKNTIQIQHLVAQQRERNEPITYWMVIGDKVVKPGWQRKLVQLNYALQHQVPDGLLFRVSTIDKNNPRAFTVHAQFISDLLMSVDSVMRRHLVGDASRG